MAATLEHDVEVVKTPSGKYHVLVRREAGAVYDVVATHDNPYDADGEADYIASHLWEARLVHCSICDSTACGSYCRAYEDTGYWDRD